ncbi:MAG: hypothetical protein RL641_293 [Candidatus Parcubacteria bacterium]|jgi:poly-gamma-glutamate capsule biosynthesis protein CapA/YwtB (metallophosphatase superfamily)
MKKTITALVGLIIVAFAIGFGGPTIYSKMLSLGIITYTPASVDTAVTNIGTVTPSITFTFGGDIMLDRGVAKSVEKNFAGDFAPLFKNAEQLFQNDDITLVNLEGPVSDKGHNVGSIYSFEMDPKVLPVMRNAGIDIVSFANNHVGDYTKAAFSDTMERLIENDISYSGAGESYAEATTPTTIEKNGMTVGFLGFTDVGPNWLAAKGEDAGILLASDPNFFSIISEAKKEVDVLVVSFHWGVEYKPHTDRQTKLAHSAIDAGADIIVGTHPHVAQDLETYKDKLIIYSLGNFIFDQYFSDETMQGLVVRTTISKDGVISNTKEYINHLDKYFAIKSIDEKYPPVKTSDTPAEIKISWVGDIPPSSTIPLFDETILSWLKISDIKAGNLEGALSSSIGPEKNTKCVPGTLHCYSFVGNDAFIKSLKSAGFNLFNLANNHALDKGENGAITTKSILADNKLAYAPESGDLITAKIKGVTVAFLGFGHNAWTQKITDIENIRKTVQDAASKYSVVVVFFHGGAEGEKMTHVPKKSETYIGEDRGDVYKFAHTAIDSGADLVLGSGPHVVRGIEKYNDRLIVYSAGNFLTTEGMSSKGLTGKGALFNIAVDQNGVYKNLGILSTTAEINNSVTADQTNEALLKIIELTKQDFNQTIASDQLGAISFQ